MKSVVTAALVGHLVVPIVFLLNVASGAGGRIPWSVNVAAAVGYYAFIAQAGRWDWFGTPVRWGYGVLLVAAVVIGGRAAWPMMGVSSGQWFDIGIYGALAVFFGVLAVRAWRGRRVDRAKALDVVWPLPDGRGYVAHGGSATSVNYHHAHQAQRYALDLVQLGPMLTRARGLLPHECARYDIFGAVVVSPVDGVVLQAVDGLPDLVPPSRDSTHVAGNHVVLQPDGADVYVLLAHLKRGSVGVIPGQRIARGERVGRVGNSGNTTEPHLHIHAAAPASSGPLGGEGVPLTFGGRFLVRNDVVEPSATAQPPV